MLKLIITEETGETIEQVFEESEVITIGRADTNRIITGSPRASRNHCKITFESGKWVIEDLSSQNGTRVNQAKVTRHPLAHRDEIRIADYRIVADLPEISQKHPAEDRTVMFDRPAADSDATTFGAAPSFAAAAGPTPLPERLKAFYEKRKLLILGGAGVIVLLLILAQVFKSSDTPDPNAQLVQTEAQKVETMDDLAASKKIKGYLTLGRELFDKGEYAKALSRFQMVLSVAPDNPEAIDYVKKCQEFAAQEAEREKEAAAKKQQLQARATDLMAQAQPLVSSKSYDKAKELLSEAVYLDPENKSAAALLEKVNTEMVAVQQQATEAAQSREDKLAEMKERYAKADVLYNQKEYLAALKEWKKVAELGVDTPELYQAQEKISEVQQLLAKTVEADYQKGVGYYQKAQYGDAAVYLQQVVAVFPDYKDSREKLAKAIGSVEETAKSLYQEGLVYEGIGQLDNARKKWEAVLKVMPVEENQYHQKAKRKLNR